MVNVLWITLDCIGCFWESFENGLWVEYSSSLLICPSGFVCPCPLVLYPNLFWITFHGWRASTRHPQYIPIISHHFPHFFPLCQSTFLDFGVETSITLRHILPVPVLIQETVVEDVPGVEYVISGMCANFHGTQPKRNIGAKDTPGKEKLAGDLESMAFQLVDDVLTASSHCSVGYCILHQALQAQDGAWCAWKTMLLLVCPCFLPLNSPMFLGFGRFTLIISWCSLVVSSWCGPGNKKDMSEDGVCHQNGYLTTIYIWW